LIPTEEAIEMAEMVLDNNNFSFNGKPYVQTDGIAIGSQTFTQNQQTNICIY